MPGSIQVSVLDFKELPITSNSIKVSLGKAEHEAGEKGIFSLPLTNLRDNLVITIQDSEGNQVSRSGVRTMSIIEKGIWDDFFPIEGGGFIHMKLEFILSDEERNRIRLMRETAMKKKQAEILASRLKNEESAKFLTSSLSRHEISDVLRETSSQDLQRSGFNSDVAKDDLSTPIDDTSVKALESSDVIKEESFQRQSFTNATDKKEEILFSHTPETIDQKATVVDTKSQDSPTNLVNKNEAVKPNLSGNLVEKLYEQNLEEKIPSDVKKGTEETTSTPLLQEPNVNSNNEIPLQKIEVPENVLKDNETRDFVKKNIVDKSEVSDNLVEKLEKQNLEEKNPSFVKKMSKENKFPPFSQETEANTIKNNEILFQEPDEPKKSSRSTIAEKIKSFTPKIVGEPNKQDPSEKTPRSIKKMISVFESSISQDKVPLKPLSTKSFKLGTSRLLKDNPVKDYYKNSESSQNWLVNSEISSSTRLRNSFSTGDLRQDLSSIITKEDQVGFDNNFIEPSETNMQSNENDPKETDFFPKDSITGTSIGVNNEEKIFLTESNTKDLPNSPQESVNNEEKIVMKERNTNKLLQLCDEDATVSGRMPLNDIKKENEKESVDCRKASKDDLEYFDHKSSGQWTFLDEKGDCKIDVNGGQEKIVDFIPEIVVKDESDAIIKQDEEIVCIPGNSNPKNAVEEACNGLVGQAIKIALVVGFGVIILLFRQRESGKSTKKENKLMLKNQVFMNKQGSIQQQRRRTGVIKLS